MNEYQLISASIRELAEREKIARQGIAIRSFMKENVPKELAYLIDEENSVENASLSRIVRKKQFTDAVLEWTNRDFFFLRNYFKQNLPYESLCEIAEQEMQLVGARDVQFRDRKQTLEAMKYLSSKINN